MSAPESELVPYRVAYSERVRTEMRALLARARAAGAGASVGDALTTLDQRLRIYLQYGECRHDLSMPGQSQWVATFPPLVVEYVIAAAAQAEHSAGQTEPLDPERLGK
jgi:hypothetical protein